MNRGQSLVELLIALGIFVTMVSVVVFILLSSYVSNLKSGENTQALFLAEEGLEAVRSIRDNNWGNLAAGSHGLEVSGSDWMFSGSQEDLSSKLKEGARQVIVEDIDSSRKKITSKVTWKSPQGLPRETSLVSRLTNWTGAASAARWVLPTKEGSLNLSGNQDGLKVQAQGNYAYLVRNGGSPDFAVIDISDTQNPLLVGSLSLTGNPRDIVVSGSYAYVASDSDTQEFQIIDVSNPSSPSISGAFDAPGGANASGIYFSASTAYLVRRSSAQDEFLAINVSDPSSPTLISSLNLASAGNAVVVLGNYAYVASSFDNQELQIIDMTVSNQPRISGSYNLSGSSDGFSIAGFGGRVILGRNNGLIYLFDVENPNSPVFLGSFNAQGVVNDLALGGNYVFLTADSSGAEFQVVDISAPASPSPIGSLDISPSSGVAFDQGEDRAFIASGADNEEFIILAPL